MFELNNDGPTKEIGVPKVTLARIALGDGQSPERTCEQPMPRIELCSITGVCSQSLIIQKLDEDSMWKSLAQYNFLHRPRLL